MTTTLTRRTARGIAVAALATGLVAVGTATANATPTTDAATWLSSQLTGGNHYVVGGNNDVGLTEDGLFAFKAAGSGYATQVTNIKNWLNSTTNIGGGSTVGYIGSSSVYYPGALAKTTLAVKAAAGNPKVWTSSNINLVSRLETTLVTSGTNAGRFADPRDTPTYYGYANPVSQALALIAIKNQDPTYSGLASAATYLRNQKCSDNGWSYQFGSCTTLDPDSTGFVTQALAYVGGTANTTAATNGNAALNGKRVAQGSGKTAWQNICQSPFTTPSPSVNSTALAIQGLTANPSGSGTYATSIANGKAWLQSAQQSNGGLPACTAAGASDVRATTQGVQGLTGLTYAALL